MSIYTKIGDQGNTMLGNGQSVSKSTPVVDFLGDLDELNSIIGVCVAYLKDDDEFELEVEVLEDIQRDLFVVGSIASGVNLKFDPAKEVSNIEETIDDYEKLIPSLKNFILPGGTIPAANLHYARTLIRKLERKLVGLNSKSMSPFLPYLNRLSDLLFVMARFVNYKSKEKETIWKFGNKNG